MPRLIVIFCTFLFSSLSTDSYANDNELNTPAPQCALTDINTGAPYSMPGFKGQVVYVDFWASWCGPCLESFPFMNVMQQELKSKGLQVVAINLDEEINDAKTFLENIKAQFLVVRDKEAECAKNFGVKAMPSSFLIDRQGTIRAVHYGFRAGEAKEFRGKVEQLLAEPGH